MITATNKHTGEVVELPTDNYEQVIQAWQIAQEYAKVADQLKNQLKKEVPKFVENGNTSLPVNGFMFRISNVQRMNYDKAVLRRNLDEDVLDLLLEPSKPKVDAYLKEHLEELGSASTEIRNAMVEVGRPYEVIKLERVK